MAHVAHGIGPGQTFWICVPRLLIEYYNKNILWGIGNCISHNVNIDVIMLKMRRGMESNYCVLGGGKFARICVEVNLCKIMRLKFFLNFEAKAPKAF
jgi:hypothetical protein